MLAGLRRPIKQQKEKEFVRAFFLVEQRKREEKKTLCLQHRSKIKFICENEKEKEQKNSIRYCSF
jgi:hypothetical protein